jgi:hypothetical protein
MKFLCLYKPADIEKAERGGPPNPEEMERMGKFVEQQMKTGALVATEGCAPTALGAKVRLNNGKVTVIDGPFTEAKEVVAGLAILQANSKQEAILMVQDFLKFAGDGEVEVRQLFDGEIGECPTQPIAASASS